MLFSFYVSSRSASSCVSSGAASLGPSLLPLDLLQRQALGLRAPDHADHTADHDERGEDGLESAV